MLSSLCFSSSVTYCRGFLALGLAREGPDHRHVEQLSRGQAKEERDLLARGRYAGAWPLHDHSSGMSGLRGLHYQNCTVSGKLVCDAACGRLYCLHLAFGRN